MLNPTFGVYFLVLARCAAGNHFWGKCSANVDIKRGVFQARIFSERSIWNEKDDTTKFLSAKEKFGAGEFGLPLPLAAWKSPQPPPSQLPAWSQLCIFRRRQAESVSQILDQRRWEGSLSCKLVSTQCKTQTLRKRRDYFCAIATFLSFCKLWQRGNSCEGKIAAKCKSANSGHSLASQKIWTISETPSAAAAAYLLAIITMDKLSFIASQFPIRVFPK